MLFSHEGLRSRIFAIASETVEITHGKNHFLFLYIAIRKGSFLISTNGPTRQTFRKSTTDKILHLYLVMYLIFPPMLYNTKKKKTPIFFSTETSQPLSSADLIWSRAQMDFVDLKSTNIPSCYETRKKFCN